MSKKTMKQKQAVKRGKKNLPSAILLEGGSAGEKNYLLEQLPEELQ